MKQTDPHLKEVNQNIDAKTPNGCEECLQMGSDWVHLRLCLSCGHVGCCDSSPNKHATAHYGETHDPLIQSFEPGEDWGWCHVDELFLEPAPLHKGLRLDLTRFDGHLTTGDSPDGVRLNGQALEAQVHERIQSRDGG